MSMDGVRDVFEHSAHLKGQGPLTNEFTDVRSNALDSEDAMVVFTGDHTNEPTGLFRFLGQGPSVGSKWELSDDDWMTGFFGLLR
jgi:hypothetical protein